MPVPRTCGRSRFALLSLIGLALLGTPAAGQVRVSDLTPGEQLYEIRLTDGSLLIARVTSVTGEMLVLTTSGGTRVEIERSQIREVREAVGQIVRGEFWREDANVSRLFFTSTGRALDKGQAYVGTYLIVLPFLAVGVTDRLTIGGGAPVLLGQIEPLYVAPKLQLLRTEEVAVSVGALHFVLSDDFDDADVGVAYAVGTFGSRDNALTVGLGFGYAGTDFSSQPVAMIGGETRVGRRAKLLTENYFLPGETGALISGGVRFLGERLSADVGVGAAIGDGDAGCCAPLVSVSYSFGGGR